MDTLDIFSPILGKEALLWLSFAKKRPTSKEIYLTDSKFFILRVDKKEKSLSDRIDSLENILIFLKCQIKDFVTFLGDEVC